MSIMPISNLRSPLIYNQKYKEFSKEIVYKISREYSKFSESHYELVNHNDHKYCGNLSSWAFSAFDNLDYDKHAYGLLFDAYHSNVVVLDFDNFDMEVIIFATDVLMSKESVQVIDLATSSYNSDGTPKGIHLYAGLDNPQNLISFYMANLRGTCEGFNNFVVSKGKIVIRISNKFENKERLSDTTIQWLEGYTRTGDNKWLKYTSGQLIVPSTSVAVPYLEKTKRTLSRTLKLRG